MIPRAPLQKAFSSNHAGLSNTKTGFRSSKESEVFGWSRIPKNTRNRGRIFLIRLWKSNSISFYISLLS